LKDPTPPSPGPGRGRIKTVPYLVRKEGIALVISLAAVCLLGVLMDAPLERPADPDGIPAEHVKAPWIFVGIQLVLRYLSPLVAGIVVPLIAFCIVAFIPFSPGGAKTRWALFFGVVVAALILTVAGYLT